MNGVTREDVTILFGFLERIAEALEGPVNDDPTEPGAMTLEYLWNAVSDLKARLEKQDDEVVKLWKAIEVEHEDVMEYIRDIQRH